MCVWTINRLGYRVARKTEQRHLRTRVPYLFYFDDVIWGLRICWLGGSVQQSPSGSKMANQIIQWAQPIICPGLALLLASRTYTRLQGILPISDYFLVIFRIANFSMVVSGAAAVTYLLDTHGPDALHVLALSNFSKNIVLYAFTFFANGMILHRGVKVSLLILASCQAFCWLASFPMYIYGKRVRSFVSHIPSNFGS